MEINMQIPHCQLKLEPFNSASPKATKNFGRLKANTPKHALN
jgi:hypothetical protein